MALQPIPPKPDETRLERVQRLYVWGMYDVDVLEQEIGLLFRTGTADEPVDPNYIPPGPERPVWR